MNFSEAFLVSMLTAKEEVSNLNHVACLCYLSQRENGASLADVSRLLKISSAGMTTIADTFENMGLAKRVRVGTDRRSYRLTITAKGRDFIDKLLTPLKP